MGGARFHDERGILGVSLIRWAIVIILGGLVVIEAGSIIFTTIGLQNAADGAALEAADAWQKTGSLSTAREVALGALADQEQDEARIPAATFEAEGPPTYEVTFTAKKQAATLLVHRIGFLEGLAQVDVTAKARPVQSDV